MVLVHYLYFCTQRFYRCSCRTSWFLEYVSTTQMITLSKTQIIKFLAIHPVRCRVWHSENLLHRSTLQFTDGCCSQWFLCHCSYLCTCLDHKLRTMWAGFRACLHAIKSCLPRVCPWCHACDKMYQAVPLLSGESLWTRLSNLPWTPQTVFDKPPSMLNSLKQYDHIDL